MKVIVAGGAGFIGSHLCEKLIEKNHYVFCLDNLITGSLKNIDHLFNKKNFQFIKTDISKRVSFSEKVDAIFHLASPASPNEESPISYHHLAKETMKANIQGTENLLELASKFKARFLFASSSEVYGDPEITPQGETYNGNVNPIGARAVYDESKRMGETITAYYWRKRNVNGRIARIFNTFGPKMRADDKRMVVNFIINALNGKPIEIYGDGKQTRSLCYIGDMVEGLIRLMFYPQTEKQVVNLGNNEEKTVFEWAKIIKKLTQSKSKIVFNHPLPEGDPKKRQPDIKKAKLILNWQPKFSVEEGLRLTIDYFKKILPL